MYRRTEELRFIKNFLFIANYLRACFVHFSKAQCTSSCSLSWIPFRVSYRSVAAVANDLIFVEVGCRQLSLFYTRRLLWCLPPPPGNSVTLFLLSSYSAPWNSFTLSVWWWAEGRWPLLRLTEGSLISWDGVGVNRGTSFGVYWSQIT